MNKTIKNIGIAIIITFIVLIVGFVLLKFNTTNQIAFNNNKNNINEQTSTSNKLANKKIFGEMAVGEGMTANDITIPENLINENYTSIVKVKVNKVSEESHIIPPTEKYYNPYVAFQPIEVTVKEVMYGDESLIGNNTFYMKGGPIKISELEKYMDDDEKVKMGISNLSSTEKEEYYIDYTVKNDFDLIEGEEYILFLAKQTDNLYFIDAEGLGIFTENNNNISQQSINNTRSFVNVLTGKEFNYNKSGEKY